MKEHIEFKKADVDNKVLALHEWLREHCGSPAEAVVVARLWLQFIEEQFGISQVEISINAPNKDN
jgi:hypothetical protein